MKNARRLPVWRPPRQIVKKARVVSEGPQALCLPSAALRYGGFPGQKLRLHRGQSEQLADGDRCVALLQQLGDQNLQTLDILMVGMVKQNAAALYIPDGKAGSVWLTSHFTAC